MEKISKDDPDRTGHLLNRGITSASTSSSHLLASVACNSRPAPIQRRPRLSFLGPLRTICTYSFCDRDPRNHLRFHFVPSFTEMGFAMLTGTKRDDVGHEVRTIVCQSQNMMSL